MSDYFRLEPDTPRPLTLAEARQAAKLGILDSILALTRERRCARRLYQYGCSCSDCTRNPREAKSGARQPWEPRPSRHAA